MKTSSQFIDQRVSSSRYFHIVQHRYFDPIFLRTVMLQYCGDNANDDISVMFNSFWANAAIQPERGLSARSAAMAC
jgi:hypothetical protein